MKIGSMLLAVLLVLGVGVSTAQSKRKIIELKDGQGKSVGLATVSAAKKGVTGKARI